MTTSSVGSGPSDAAVLPAGFRLCPYTGRRVHLGAERLIKVHAVASVVSLLVGRSRPYSSC